MNPVVHSLFCELSDKVGAEIHVPKNSTFKKGQITTLRNAIVGYIEREFSLKLASVLPETETLFNCYDPLMEGHLHTICQLVYLLDFFDGSIDKATTYKAIKNAKENVDVKKVNEYQAKWVNSFLRENNIPDELIRSKIIHEKYKEIAGNYLCIRSSINGRWIHFYKVNIAEDGKLTKMKLRKDEDGRLENMEVSGQVIDIDSKPESIRFLVKIVIPGKSKKDEGFHSYYYYEKKRTANKNDYRYRGFQVGVGFSDDFDSASKRSTLRLIDETNDKHVNSAFKELYTLCPFDLCVNAASYRQLPLSSNNQYMPMRLGGSYDNVMRFHDANDPNKKLPIIIGDAFFKAAANLVDRRHLSNIEELLYEIRLVDESPQEHSDSNLNRKNEIKKRNTLIKSIINEINLSKPKLEDYILATKFLKMSAEHASSQDFNRRFDSKTGGVEHEKDRQRDDLYLMIREYYDKCPSEEQDKFVEEKESLVVQLEKRLDCDGKSVKFQFDKSRNDNLSKIEESEVNAFLLDRIQVAFKIKPS